MTAFYNEHDAYAAQYLRNLMAAGLIASGVVDERDIQEIEPWELLGYTQVHMFAGIGIWSGALRAAGWPDDEPIWTGSCPCQPFSNAGQKKGFSDDRHLWPTWRSLVAECGPSRIAGEQVASKDGRIWLDTVSADMEALGFAFGAADLCAAGFGGAHIRQRNYFVGLADSDDERLERWAGMLECGNQLPVGPGSLDGGMAEPYSRERYGLTNSKEREPNGATGGRQQSDSGATDDRGFGRLVYADHGGLESWERDYQTTRQRAAFAATRNAGGMEHADVSGQNGRRTPSGQQSLCHVGNIRDAKSSIRHSRQTLSGYWHDVDWLLCRNPTGEPSWRPVESGTFPLAHGVADRMGKLRAYGNALDFETAKGFCEILVEICLGL